MRITPSISILSVSASLSSAQEVNFTHPIGPSTQETTALNEMYSADPSASFVGTTNLTMNNGTKPKNETTEPRINRFKVLSNRIRAFFKSWRKPDGVKEEDTESGPAFVRRR